MEAGRRGLNGQVLVPNPATLVISLANVFAPIQDQCTVGRVVMGMELKWNRVINIYAKVKSILLYLCIDGYLLKWFSLYCRLYGYIPGA